MFYYRARFNMIKYEILKKILFKTHNLPNFGGIDVFLLVCAVWLQKKAG